VGFGDELMTAGRARVMQQTDPRRIQLTYGGKTRTLSPVFWHNPRIAAPGEEGDFQELQARDRNTNMRPYHTGKTPECWHYNLDFRPDVGELYLDDKEKAFGAKYAGRVVIDPHIKPGASPNKRWPWLSWGKLAFLLSPLGIRLAQVGPAGAQELMGVEFIQTDSFRLAAAVIAQARAVVLHEGGLHHAAAALGVPGVVIMGGFTPVELTGYAIHRNLGASLDDACGMRAPCKHCAKWMASIAPETVKKELMEILQ
jgi:ADP-heptose:LPS heptosyltransferase